MAGATQGRSEDSLNSPSVFPVGEYRGSAVGEGVLNSFTPVFTVIGKGNIYTPPLCFAEQNIGEVPVRAEGFKSHIQTINSIFFQPLSSGRCPSVSPLYC